MVLWRGRETAAASASAGFLGGRTCITATRVVLGDQRRRRVSVVTLGAGTRSSGKRQPYATRHAPDRNPQSVPESCQSPSRRWGQSQVRC